MKTKTGLTSGTYDVTVTDANGCEDIKSITILEACLTIVKDVDLTNIDAPGLLTYTITVDNTGNTDITNVVLSDNLAGTATLTSGDTNTNLILETTETWVYTATYTATQADINAGSDLVNTASVVTTEVPGPTEDDATTTITQTPSLTVVKDVDLTVITGPGLLTYAITVTNTGNTDLTNVVLSDDLAGAATLDSGDTNTNSILETTETWVYSATYTVTQADINAGTALVNTASVVTTEVPGPRKMMPQRQLHKHHR